MEQRLKIGALLLAMAAFSAPARAQGVAGEVPLADVLEILVVDRELLAIDAAGGGQTTARLRLNETVVWKGARGKVGVIITDQRILAVATQSGSWQEADYGRTEQRPESALLGERVALAITSERVLGFNGGSGNLVEYRLGPANRWSSRASAKTWVWWSPIVKRSGYRRFWAASSPFRSRSGIGSKPSPRSRTSPR